MGQSSVYITVIHTYLYIRWAQLTLTNCHANPRPRGLWSATYFITVEVSCGFILVGSMEYWRYLQKNKLNLLYKTRWHICLRDSWWEIINYLERFSFECRKVIGFALSTRCDWLKRFAPPFHPIRSKTKANCDALARFSRALRQPHVITSSFDWFNVLSVSYVIGQSNYFGFGFTTLKRKPLYYTNQLTLQRYTGYQRACKLKNLATTVAKKVFMCFLKTARNFWGSFKTTISSFPKNTSYQLEQCTRKLYYLFANIKVLLNPLSPKYPHTNSPDRSLYIFLKT